MTIIPQKKDPDAIERFSVDWSARLEDATIVTSTWLQEPPDGLTLNNDSADDTTASVFIADGTVGDTHTITNRITTSVGETLDQSFTVTIRPA